MNARKAMRHGDYLGHILEAVRLARGYCENMERADFLTDRKTQQAVIFNLLIIGEAATQLCNEYPEFVAQHPLFPWKQMRGAQPAGARLFRNRPDYRLGNGATGAPRFGRPDS